MPIVSAKHPSITSIQNSFHIALNGWRYRKYMKGSPSGSTVAMLVEAFSPKHTSAVCEGPISSDPLSVMKHKLFNRNQLRTTERRRLARRPRRYLPVKSGALNRNPRSFPRGRRWKRSGRSRPLLFLYVYFERFYFFSRNWISSGVRAFSFSLNKQLENFDSIPRWILVIEIKQRENIGIVLFKE